MTNDQYQELMEKLNSAAVVTKSNFEKLKRTYNDIQFFIDDITQENDFETTLNKIKTVLGENFL
jgi:hypothetical protein